MRQLRIVNFRGDLFATGASFAGQTVLKLCSSIILTRILTPGDYGTITILMSVVFILVMLSDIGFSVCIVRSTRGEDQAYLNTAWTIRIVRAVINTALLYLLAPLIAALYHAPTLTLPFRVLSVWFLIDGAQSTAFPVSVRRKNSKIVMYSELTGTVWSTIFTVVYCYYSRDYWGMLYGALVNRLIVVVLSHRYYRDIRPSLQWDWPAAREIFEYTRFVMPSSVLTLVLNQFDRAIFLRLFDFRLLGVYSLAGNIITPVENLITKASQMVLYPRCAHNYRTDKTSFSLKYYLENIKVFIAILGIPAAIGGAAHFLISALYDPRYAGAAAVLQAFAVRAVLKGLASPAEDMLIATGESRLILVANVYRVIWMVAAGLLGYKYFGFMGFTYGIALSGLPGLLYYLWLQYRKDLLIVKFELYKVAFAGGVGACAYAAAAVLLALFPGVRIHFHL